MTRKLTITVSEEVYEGLHRTVGRRRTSQFLEKLARPHVLSQDIETAYQELAADQEREQQALAWSESVIGDVNKLDAAR
jgi:predicted CopG family antitoxin